MARSGLRTGFTFVELIFTITVLGILLAAAIPRLRRGWSGLQMERTAFDLAQLMRTARVLAITQGKPVEWIWDEGIREVCLGPFQALGCAEALTDRAARPKTIPEAVDLTVLQDDTPVERIIFQPDGTSQQTLVLIGEESAPRFQIVVDGSTSQVVVR